MTPPTLSAVRLISPATLALLLAAAPAAAVTLRVPDDHATIQAALDAARPGSDDSGLFWFFNADNWEMLVKVLDGCRVNGRYWVFAAATTNVGYTLRVTDTASGAAKSYVNPLGVASPALTDTDAFARCP